MGDFRSSVQSESQSYSVPRLSHGGNQQSSSAANRAERADREHGELEQLSVFYPIFLTSV